MKTTNLAPTRLPDWLRETRRLLFIAKHARWTGGQFVKKPFRVMEAFGLINLLRFRFGLGPIHHIFQRISRHLDVEIAPLLVSNGATAIDVDNENSLRVTEALMKRANMVNPRPNSRESRAERGGAGARQLAVIR